VFFDTLCVSFSFVFFKFLVFEAAIFANKDVYINKQTIYNIAEIKNRIRGALRPGARNGDSNRRMLKMTRQWATPGMKFAVYD